MTFECENLPIKKVTIDYPFRFGETVCPKRAVANVVTNATLSVNLASDAQFFVATGVLSILYCIFIVAVYTIIDEIYKTKSEIPLAVSIPFETPTREFHGKSNKHSGI